MNFSTSISTCLRKYFTFAGRAMRSEFWWFVLFYLLGGLILGFVDQAVFDVDPVTGQQRQLFSPVWSLVLYIPLLAAAWRRLHDTGRPGWYALIPMMISAISLVGLFAGIFTFAKLSSASPDPEVYRTPAAWMGMTGIMLVLIAQLVVTVLLIYWLSRPSQPTPNLYGPTPQAYR